MYLYYMIRHGKGKFIKGGRSPTHDIDIWLLWMSYGDVSIGIDNTMVVQDMIRCDQFPTQLSSHSAMISFVGHECVPLSHPTCSSQSSCPPSDPNRSPSGITKSKSFDFSVQSVVTSFTRVVVNLETSQKSLLHGSE